MDVNEAIKTIGRYLAANNISLMLISPTGAVPLNVCGEKTKIMEPHDVVLTEIAEKHGITVSDLFRKTRQQPLATARQEAIVGLKKLGWSVSRIARYFNIHHSTVIHALRKDS